MYLLTYLLNYLGVRRRRKESSRSLSHLLMSFLYHYDTAISTDFVFLSDCSSTKSIVKDGTAASTLWSLFYCSAPLL